MPLVETRGDLFNSNERIIAHGCNCVGLMGAGVAGIVAKKFPIAFEKYQKAIEAKVFNVGYAQFVIDQEKDTCIYNLATQRNPGRDATPWGVYLSFCNMLEHAKANQISRIAIPRIGAGIGGLDWEEDCLPSIVQAMSDAQSSVQIVIYVL